MRRTRRRGGGQRQREGSGNVEATEYGRGWGRRGEGRPKCVVSAVEGGGARGRGWLRRGCVAVCEKPTRAVRKVLLLCVLGTAGDVALLRASTVCA